MGRKFMKITIILLLCVLSFNSNAQELDGNYTPNSITNSQGVIYDQVGNSYVTGGYFDSITFGSITLNGGGVFLAKFDSSGDCIWARHVGGNNNDFGRGIALDSNGNVVLSGRMNYYNFFISKYDSSGMLKWIRHGNGNDWDEATDIAVDGNGNSYVTGFFNSYNFQINSIVLSSWGGFDIFFAKFDPIGNLVWLKQTGSSMWDFGREIDYMSDGFLYAVGDVNSPSTFGNFVNTNFSGRYYAKMDTDGNFYNLSNAYVRLKDKSRYHDLKSSSQLDISWEF